MTVCVAEKKRWTDMSCTQAADRIRDIFETCPGPTPPLTGVVTPLDQCKLWTILYRTYILKCSPSSIVSGSCLPRVSGRNNRSSPPTMHVDPKMSSGNGSQYSSRSNIRGASIPATLAAMEHNPIPVLLKV